VRCLRPNQGIEIGSRRKPTSIEALKADVGMTREHAESCGESWACWGELVAIGGLLQLGSASVGTENRADRKA
jgi:hypothetical protein